MAKKLSVDEALELYKKKKDAKQKTSWSIVNSPQLSPQWLRSHGFSKLLELTNSH